jgi:hypothetical protein
MKTPKSARTLAARNEFKKPVMPFEEIDLSKVNHTKVPKGMTRAFRNTRYMVMVYDGILTTHGGAIRVMVQKHDDTPIMNHWAQMFAIKNEIFGTETTAVEYYPAKSRLLDDHNIYWMFIYPENILPIPF